MGNLMIPETGAVPAHLRQSAPVESGLVTSNESLPRISLRGKQFRFIIDGEEKAVLPLGSKLPIIILGASPKGKSCSKIFYAGAWDPDSADPPDCSSSDGLYPDSGVAHPQSDMCQTCKQNAWGSGTKADGSPSAGKACRDTKTLFVVSPTKPNGHILQLRVPVMSLKALNSLGHELENRRMHTYAIVTELSFADAEFPQIDFAFKEFLGVDAYAVVEARAQSDEVQKLISAATTRTAPVDQIPAEAPTHATQAAEEPSQAETTTSIAPEVEPINLGDIWGEDTATPGQGVHDDSVPGEAPVVETAAPFKGPGQNPADGLWYDKTGAVWDKSLHATGRDGNPIFNGDGSFRKKANRTKKGAPDPAGQPSTQPAAQQPAQQPAAIKTESEEDLLDGWT